MTIYGDTPGYIYILCFSAPLGNLANTRAQASHYLGWAVDLPRRLAQHAAGHGAPITQAAVERGMTWTVYYRAGTPELERWLKANYKKTPCLCPPCSAARKRTPAYGFQPLDQLAFPVETQDDFDFPAPPRLPMDWMEIATMRRWRAARAVLPATDLAMIDDLI